MDSIICWSVTVECDEHGLLFVSCAVEECGARDLRSRDDFREKFNKGLEFRLEMDAVSGNDRPVGVSFPARDHEDATARDSFDVMININDEGD